MTVRLFRGSEALPSLPPDDRGLAYGDGVFETLRAAGGTLPWWDAHWRRLRRGAARLRFDPPAEHRVLDEALDLLAGGDAVLKLLVTRGTGERGYAPRSQAPTWVLSRHPAPTPSRQGLHLRWCRLRLAEQPALAGIKHCNRLEQVLARAEWADLEDHEAKADDGLMLGTHGEVVAGTSANLFILRDGRWSTPEIVGCGIRGVCREWLLPRLPALEQRLRPEDVEAAEAVFLCNAARGILPVARLHHRTWPPHPEVDAVRRLLASEHPGFALPWESP